MSMWTGMIAKVESVGPEVVVSVILSLFFIVLQIDRCLLQVHFGAVLFLMPFQPIQQYSTFSICKTLPLIC